VDTLDLVATVYGSDKRPIVLTVTDGC